MKRWLKILLILAGAAAAGLIAVGVIRVKRARQAADKIARETVIDTAYETAAVDSKEALLTEIWKLAVWEEETKEALNTAYHFKDEDYSKWRKESKTGYEKEKELLTWAGKEKWHELRTDLSDTVMSCISTWFGETGEKFGIRAESVKLCFRNDKFIKIVNVMQSVENGAGMEAYDLARYGLDEEWSSLPMDVAYGLRPKLLKAGCEAHLLSAEKSRDLYDINSAIKSAKEFEKRYRISVDGIKSAEAKQKQLEYANKPEIPAVGMSVSQAKSTKLGAPTRTSTQTGSWSHAKHTYGEMYWDVGGKQIFKVHYFDGEITDVYDSRNSKAKSPWAGSGSSGSSSSYSFDPDDHDIEAYYEDNRDEYDDYDDAYEGFLDDEGVWDDY